MFKPKLFDTFQNYNRQQFSKDLLAGIIVGIVALPLAIAFAIASGVSPEKGLFTAVIAGFVISENVLFLSVCLLPRWSIDFRCFCQKETKRRST